MPFEEILGVAPWVAITALFTWGVQLYVYRTKRMDQRTQSQDAHDERMTIHRDELTFQLLQNARTEMSSARLEVEDLRDEVRKLRSMENHFFHFQQSLDHLEALLFSQTVEEKSQAERNARAFLNRMRRLNDAKGTIANEVQRAASEVQILSRAHETDPRLKGRKSKDEKNDQPDE